MTSQTTKSLRALLLPVLIGLGVAVSVGTLCLLLSALVMRWVDVPPTAITPLAVSAAVIGAFIGGLSAAATAGRRGLIYGTVCGLGLYLLILLAGLIRAHGIDPGYSAIKLAALTSAGAIGGVLGVTKRR